MTASEPIAIVASSRPAASAPKNTTSRPSAAGATDREPHLVVGPGDRVEDGDDDREQGQRDHDREERQVAEARAPSRAR